MASHRSITWLTLYAIAMAYLEAVVVVYLRTMYYPDHPVQIFPLSPLSQRDLLVEIGRELATVVMILGVAALAAQRPMAVFGGFVYVFGVWDLFYYIWLKLIIGWPTAWLEWDLLFLIPWPWLGPWIAAALVALLFVLWGVGVLVRADDLSFSRRPALLFVAGAILVLASFLSPAVPFLAGGEEAIRR